MRRVLALILLLALAAVPVLLSGCGSEDLEPVSAAEAAQGTREAETARMTSSATIEGGPFDGVTLTGSGVTATAEPELDLTFDFGPLLERSGLDVDGRVRALLADGRLYIDPPDLGQLEIPGGAQWVTADLGAVLDAMGIDADGLGEIMRLTPAQQVEALEAVDGLKTVGEEEVDGEPTTHMKGTVTVKDFVEALPAGRAAEVEKALSQFEALGGGETTFDTPQDVEMWIDGEHRVRRLIQATKIPAQNGIPSYTMKMQLELSDFGVDADIEAPDADDVFDATDFVVRAVRNQLPRP